MGALRYLCKPDQLGTSGRRQIVRDLSDMNCEYDREIGLRPACTPPGRINDVGSVVS